MSAGSANALAELGRTSIEKGSRSFATAARLFPADTRDSALLLYAACRYCDDLIDGQDMGFVSDRPAAGSPETRLVQLETQMAAVLRGEQVNEPVFGALQTVVTRHRIPPAYVMDFLHGFRMDVEGHRYSRIEDTLRYSYHVAGVVGVMMAIVMGARDSDTLDRACDLGIAFQLTNIARDVLDDAALGRCYLPEDWLLAEGMSPESVTAPDQRDALARVVSDLVDYADQYYASALTGLPSLDFRSAWAIATARGIYRDIGIQVRRQGAKAWDARISTGQGRKFYRLVRGALRAGHAVSLGRLRRPRPRSDRLWTRPMR